MWAGMPGAVIDMSPSLGPGVRPCAAALAKRLAHPALPAQRN
jgi:hypothetical protein